MLLLRSTVGRGHPVSWEIDRGYPEGRCDFHTGDVVGPAGAIRLQKCGSMRRLLYIYTHRRFVAEMGFIYSFGMFLSPLFTDAWRVYPWMDDAGMGEGLGQTVCPVRSPEADIPVWHGGRETSKTSVPLIQR